MNTNKFTNQLKTLNGDDRAFVEFTDWQTLWLNSGTKCNLACEHCYIESSPTNDRLEFIKLEDVLEHIIDFSKVDNSKKRIGITGGEPFINPHILDIIKEVLSRNISVLVLSNGVNVMNRVITKLEQLNEQFPNKLSIRISLDHYTREIHEKERGLNTFTKAVDAIELLYTKQIPFSVAGRSLQSEDMEQASNSYIKLLKEREIPLSKDQLVIFPEMDLDKDVPEISTKCWDILKKSPDQQMCASERMIVKQKGKDKVQFQACTLLAYQEEFNMGSTLKESTEGAVHLNHPFCAQFCVLGGASCSST